MTPLHGVWISSCVGAVLFWLAGYLTARRRTRELPAPAQSDGPDPSRLQSELKAALDRELRVVADLSIARGEQTAASAALLQSGEELATLRTELEAARRGREVATIEARNARAAEQNALDSAAQRIAALERRLAESANASGRAEPGARASLEQELERTRAEAGARETESKRLRASFEKLQAEKKELLAKLSPAASPPATRSAPRSDHEKLQAEAERLRVAILHGRSERDAAVARARDLEGELQRLRKGGSTILGPKDPVAAMERAKHDLRLARNELGRLQKELDESKLSRGKPLTGETPAVANSPLPPGELGDLLRSLLGEVARNGRTRDAVVADESGLVIASSGGEAEALAAAAAVFVDSASRVLRSVLPLGTLQNLSVVDEHDVTIAAQPLAVGEHALILATLSDGPGPDPAAVRAVIGLA